MAAMSVIVVCKRSITEDIDETQHVLDRLDESLRDMDTRIVRSRELLHESKAVLRRHVESAEDLRG
jgi:hypothetical protein